MARNRKIVNMSSAILLALVGTISSLQALDITDQTLKMVPNTVSGEWSTALGQSTSINGWGSFVVGYQTSATNNYAAAFGVDTIASGGRSFVGGYNSRAENWSSFAFGEEVISSGYISFAIGYDTDATNSSTFSGGTRSEATGPGAFAYGNEVDSTAWYSAAFGSETLASAYHAVAFGYKTKATQGNAFAIGDNTTSSGFNTFAQGGFTHAQGNNSVALGGHSKAFGNESIASGWHVHANAGRVSAFGQYNIGGGTFNDWIETEHLFEIGNGVGDLNADGDADDPGERSNAVTVLKNGKTTLDNAYWDDQNPTLIPAGQDAIDGSDAVALEVNGHVRFNGNVDIIVQGDIPMGAFE